MTDDTKMTMRKSEEIEDWFIIERAEHDGRRWFEPVRGAHGEEIGASYQHSARLSDADIEGSLFEMVALARAIQLGQSASFKRCAAHITEAHDGYEFSSPRNSTRPHVASMAAARALAAEILAPFVEQEADNRPPKERAYDEKIHPLMARIIEVCKEHQINMVCDFSLGVDATGENLLCTTAMVPDESDETGKRRVDSAMAAWRRQPQLIAIMTTGPRVPAPKGDAQ